MKLKNVIIGFATFLIIPACADEKLMEEEGETGTFSINLFQGTVDTKAEISASDIERTIDKCFIAVFSKKSENDNWSNLVWKGISKVQNLDSKTFQINGLVFPIKTPLKIVAIANPPSEIDNENFESKYSNIDSYSSLLSITTVYGDQLGGGEGAGRYYTFNPRTLIKFGEKDVTFNTKSGEETIELTQLAAKIHLNLTIEEKESKLDPKDDEYTFSFGEYPVKDILGMLNKDNGIQSAKEDRPCYITDDGGQLVYVTSKPENVIASAYVQSDRGKKYIILSGGKICKLSYKPSYLFKVKEVNMYNIEIFSNLFNPRGKTPSHTLKSISPSGVNITNFSFYSYTKPLYKDGDADEVLKVTFKGGMAEGYEVTTTEYPYKNTRLEWSEDSGFGSDGFVVKPENIEGLGDPSAPIVGDIEFVSDNENTNSYTIIINPSGATVDNPGVLCGNYYEVTGKLKETIAGLNVTVEKWQPKDVNVGYGKE